VVTDREDLLSLVMGVGCSALDSTFPGFRRRQWDAAHPQDAPEQRSANKSVMDIEWVLSPSLTCRSTTDGAIDTQRDYLSPPTTEQGQSLDRPSRTGHHRVRWRRAPVGVLRSGSLHQAVTV
jgi:hypothetical protein